MAVLTTRPKGTQDVLPKEANIWHFLEKTLADQAANHGFCEIRTPDFEHTELFLRSVGDTTDIVNKEMYTFLDKGDRSVTLRPEGTAGALRAAVENGLVSEALPVAVYYMGKCFRYEKPQAGRFRQFNQFGVELLGADAPAADAEVMNLGVSCLEALGLQNISLQINSIGCPNCRKAYQQALVAYFEQYKGELCPTCLERLEKNPMRILDCKSPVCGEIAKNAPTNLQYLCSDCNTHFEQVKELLSASGLAYTVNPRIVRGLDYYNRTVFEFVTTQLGAQSAVGGGGRYNGLVAQLGGPDLPGIGFAMGMERILMLMEKQGCAVPPAKACDLYLVPMGDAAVQKAATLAKALRAEGFYAAYDLMGRSMKAQMKYANKLGAKFTLALGDNELATGVGQLKEMQTGEAKQISLSTEGVLSALYDANIAGLVEAITQDMPEAFGL